MLRFCFIGEEDLYEGTRTRPWVVQLLGGYEAALEMPDRSPPHFITFARLRLTLVNNIPTKVLCFHSTCYQSPCSLCEPATSEPSTTSTSKKIRSPADPRHRDRASEAKAPDTAREILPL